MGFRFGRLEIGVDGPLLIFLSKKPVSFAANVAGDAKVKPPVAGETFTGLIKHIKENGGITIGFDGEIINKGLGFSILDKADEARIKIDSLKERYGTQSGANFGGWVDGGYLIVDVAKVGDDILQSIYEGIIKRQDAIGDLAKYAAAAARARGVGVPSTATAGRPGIVPAITESTFTDTRNWLGKTLEDWGFSVRGTFPGAKAMAYRLNFIQNSITLNQFFS